MKFVSGLVLIDAPHSALNMMGTDTSTPDRNKVVVKKLKCGRDSYAYVSAQAWRYWWRLTLKEHFNWELSPVEKVEGKNQVYTKANPIKYPDDDIFGYMKAMEDFTVTRISPLKNTPLISILPVRNSLTSDFANTSRHEGDPVIYEMEFYSTVLKGAFSLDLDAVGRFSLIDKAGFRNIIDFEKYKEDKKKSKKLEKIRKEINWDEEYLKAAKEIGVIMKKNEWIMPNDIRAKRATETIKALKYLYGGAKQTLFLTDVTPKFIALGMFNGGINPFISDIFYEDRGEIVFNKEALVKRLEEFKDVLESKKIFFGFDEGFIKKWGLEEIKDIKINGIEVIYGSVGEILEEISKEISNYYNLVLKDDQS
ncbi:CRISPR-associated autoregulator, DevR family [Methanocaldococcus infernus ME]|uniref:CRISPR-associated autoregulator, DevR family n=1 Tax=Methanocaldococcus infernus (strain DSM 11812 / JCM 15783 / ME) TaxID=573063 RepID=D5VSN2_METIM|nr:type I-B CRISPR-associated protein Cas7/Cst2/DevR [Methanocaldococcus infernus]ADG13585.1 CRISPR-associated autoregulator, DevR family [Methanocaldococcus infernus ME]